MKIANNWLVCSKVLVKLLLVNFATAVANAITGKHANVNGADFGLWPFMLNYVHRSKHLFSNIVASASHNNVRVLVASKTPCHDSILHLLAGELWRKPTWLQRFACA